MGILRPRKRTPIGYQRAVNAALKGAIPFRDPGPQVKGVDLAHWILNWLPHRLTAARTIGVPEITIPCGSNGSYDSTAANEVIRVCGLIGLSASVKWMPTAEGFRYQIQVQVPTTNRIQAEATI